MKNLRIPSKDYRGLEITVLKKMFQLRVWNLLNLIVCTMRFTPFYIIETY